MRSIHPKHRVVTRKFPLAFALELYLKTLLAQLDVQVPQHRDLSRLYEALPLSVREPIEATYDTGWRSRWHGKRASLTIAKGPPDSPIWNDYQSEPKDLANLLARSRDVFQSWRYIWEYTEPPQGLYQLHQFEYGLLLCACEAVRASIIRRLEDTPGPA